MIFISNICLGFCRSCCKWSNKLWAGLHNCEGTYLYHALACPCSSSILWIFFLWKYYICHTSVKASKVRFCSCDTLAWIFHQCGFNYNYRSQLVHSLYHSFLSVLVDLNSGYNIYPVLHITCLSEVSQSDPSSCLLFLIIYFTKNIFGTSGEIQISPSYYSSKWFPLRFKTMDSNSGKLG